MKKGMFIKNKSFLITLTLIITFVILYSLLSLSLPLASAVVSNNTNCTSELVNSSWSEWNDISSCVNSLVKQKRFAIQYDKNDCDTIDNKTVYDYQFVDCDFCTVSLTNTTWSKWLNVTQCQQNNLIQQSRNLTQYDKNQCGDYEDVTFFQYQNSSCDFCVPKLTNVSLSDWINITSCSSSNTLTQSHDVLQYDTNACNEIENKIIAVTRKSSCDFCVPNIFTIVWEDWKNITTCQRNNQTKQMKTELLYDINSCNEFMNRTNISYRYINCDYCTPNIVNSNWSEWKNVTRCSISNKINQSRYMTQYDNNSCNEIDDVKLYEYNQANCDYCMPNLVNVSLNNWQDDSECYQNNTKRIKKDMMQYDKKSCGEINNTVFSIYNISTCDYCTPKLANISISNWTNFTSCLQNNTIRLSRNILQYDIKGCNEIPNVTFQEFKTESCDFCVPNITTASITGWTNSSSCKQNNIMIQKRKMVEYDFNNCKEITNKTYFVYGSIFCDFCTPNIINSSWSEWSNITACFKNDSLMQERTSKRYDTNFCSLNETPEFTQINYSEKRVVSCDFCTPKIINSSWSEWSNITACSLNDTLIEQRSRVQYDINRCSFTQFGEESLNQTYIETRSKACDFCTPKVINVTSDWTNFTSCKKNNLLTEKRDVFAIDINNCNEVANKTFVEYKDIPCDFCTPKIINSSWSEWSNITACSLNDTLIQKRTLITYDENICGEINNKTVSELRNIDCNYCSSDISAPLFSPWSICEQNTKTRTKYYVDKNYASCCKKTLLSSDCEIKTIYKNITENSSEGCFIAPVVLTVNNPKFMIYDKALIPINVSTGVNVDKIEYIDYSNNNPKWNTLCAKCSDFGLLKKQTKSFKDGNHTIGFKSTKDGISQQENITFFIDSTKPKISSTEPKSNSYSNGSNFIVNYNEVNLKNASLFFGTDPLVKLDCPAGKKEVCLFNLDLESYNKHDISYYFILTDIAGNTVQSKPVKIHVDTSSPIINNPNTFWSKDTKNPKYVNFNISITELNLDSVQYIDSFDGPKARSNTFCSKLNKNNECTAKKSFKTGVHNLTIEILDNAGNSAQEEISFTI